MSELELLTNSLNRLFERHVPQSGRSDDSEAAWASGLWNAFEEAGLSHPGLESEHGGAELGLAGECNVAERTAWHAAPLLASETMLAGRLLASAGMAIPEGPMTATLLSGGAATRVPWCDHLRAVVLLRDDSSIALVKSAMLSPRISCNLAGEQRADFTIDGLAPEFSESGFTGDQFMAHGALLRAAQIGGAIDRAVAMAVDHANTRKQFGKPIGKFQAIQQQLAVMAEEAAATRSAVAQACHGGDFLFRAAVAKARAGEAARVASGIAHQVHGAIGFAMEHNLQFLTRRLLSWRSEFGNDRYWQTRIGGIVAAGGGEGLWPLICGQ